MEAKKLISLLSKKKLTIASVESLTAGLFIATLANVPGASNVVKGGLVTYQTSLKTNILGIKKEVIKKYGVVSKEVAALMAKNGKKYLKSDIVVSFTGNAGPSREPGEAEIGRVHIAILCKPNEMTVYHFTKVYKGSRNAIRNAVVSDAIKLIYQKIND